MDSFELFFRHRKNYKASPEKHICHAEALQDYLIKKGVIDLNSEEVCHIFFGHDDWCGKLAAPGEPCNCNCTAEVNGLVYQYSELVGSK